MTFPPRLGSSVLAVSIRPLTGSALVTLGTVTGYTVKLGPTGGTEELVMVETRDESTLLVPAGDVFDVAYSMYAVGDHVVGELEPKPKPEAPAPKPTNPDDMPF